MKQSPILMCRQRLTKIQNATRSAYLSNVCDKLNLGLTLLFTAELGVNLFAHWFSKFWESGYYWYYWYYRYLDIMITIFRQCSNSLQKKLILVSITLNDRSSPLIIACKSVWLMTTRKRVQPPTVPGRRDLSAYLTLFI